MWVVDGPRHHLSQNGNESWYEWLLSAYGGISQLHFKLLGSSFVGHLLCSVIVIPVWHRQLLYTLFQIISLLRPKCIHCCPQMSVPYSAAIGLWVLTWGTGYPVLCHVLVKQLFCFPYVQVCAAHCIELHTSHCSPNVWVFCPTSLSASDSYWAWSLQVNNVCFSFPTSGKHVNVWLSKMGLHQTNKNRENRQRGIEQ